MALRKLTCDMTNDCTERVTHLGEKGFVYCSNHAPQRQGWERTRKLRAWEIKELLAGRRLKSYTYKARKSILSILKRTYYTPSEGD